MQLKKVLITVTIIYTILITTLSLVNLSHPVETIKIAHLDKYIHFCLYFGLNILVLLMLKSSNRDLLLKQQLLSTLIVVIYSFLIEIVQSFVGREFDLLDLLANIAGACFALLIFRNSVKFLIRLP